MSPPVIVESDPALPVVHVSLAFDAGSLLDPPGKEGATALLFRLMRRSVPGMTAPEIERALDSMGASVSVDVARSASAILLTCLRRSFASCGKLILQMLQAPPHDAEEFERLKRETQAQFTDSLDNDAWIARRFFSRYVFDDHPYCRPTSGTPASVERIELSDLQAIYRSIVTSERLLGAFAGDVTVDEGEEFIGELRRSLSASAQESRPEVVDPKVRPGRHLYFVDKPARAQTQILIGGLGAHPKDPDRTPLYVGNTIFGGTFSARLSNEVRGKRGWSYGAYSQLAHDRARQSFSMWTFPQASDAPACIALELDLLQNFIERGVSSKELSAAQKYLINSHAFSLDTASKRASLALDRVLYDLPPVETFEQRIKATTLEAVNAAVLHRLSHENLTLVVLGTKDELLGQVQSAIPRLADTHILPYDLRD